MKITAGQCVISIRFYNDTEREVTGVEQPKLLIRVNVGSGQVTREALPEVYNDLGGRGLTSRLLADEVPPRCDPLGRDNKLVIAPGLLAGTLAPCSGRTSFGAKSPLTGGIKESNAGGTAARILSSLGVRAIVIEGEPPGDRWYLLHVTQHGAELLSADHLVGRGNYATVEELRKTYGPNTAVISIGPVGEKRLPVASIAVTDIEGRPCRHAGRGGMGAVLGAKGIKAIVLEPGHHRNVPAKPEEFRRLAGDFARNLAKTKVALTQQGTAMLVEIISKVGGLPTHNFRQGTSPYARDLSGDTLAALCRERGGKTGHRCSPGCVIRCSNVFCRPDGSYLTSGLEFETIGLLGSNCGIGQLDDVATLDFLCDDYGMDTMEMGDTLAVAMEAGVLPFGDVAAARKALESVARGELLGRLLGHGTAIAGRVLGVRRIPAVKGQGISAYDPRALKGTGVTYATSPMGADHTAGNCLPGRGNVNIYRPEGQVELSLKLQVISAFCDLAGFCIFVGPVPENLEIFASLLAAYHGGGIDVEELGKGVLRTELDFNMRAGLGPEANDLPAFFREEPLGERKLLFDVPREQLISIFAGLLGDNTPSKTCSDQGKLGEAEW